MSSSAFSSGKVQHHKYTASQQFIIDHVFAKDGPGYMFWSDSLKLGPQVDALGIDLGTTRTGAARCTPQGTVEMAIDQTFSIQEILVPSVVAKLKPKLDEAGDVIEPSRWVVGRAAIEARKNDEVVEGEYYEHLKQVRHKNPKEKDGSVENLQKQKVITYPLKIDEQFVKILVEGNWVFPEEVEKNTVIKVLATSFVYWNQVFERVSIACPEAFKIPQVRATLKILTDMGITVIGVVSEPMCAFLYQTVKAAKTEYDLYKKELLTNPKAQAPELCLQNKKAVVDLGGGTCDISINTITKYEEHSTLTGAASNKDFWGGDSEVPTIADLDLLLQHFTIPLKSINQIFGLICVANTGDIYLGGDRWTLLFMYSFREEILSKYGVDIDDHKSTAVMSLLDKFREAKEGLSYTTSYQITLDNFYLDSKSNKWSPLKMTVTRAQFNVIIAVDVETIVQLLDQCFQIAYDKSGLRPEWKYPKVDLILAGGASRTVLLEERLMEVFGPSGKDCINLVHKETPDEIIARGAAIHAALKDKVCRDEPSMALFSNIELENTLCYSFGVGTRIQRRIQHHPKKSGYYVLERQEIAYVLQKGMTVPTIFYRDFVPTTKTQNHMYFTCYATDTGAVLPVIFDRDGIPIGNFKVPCAHGKRRTLEKSKTRVFFYMNEDRILEVFARDANGDYQHLQIEDYETTRTTEDDENATFSRVLEVPADEYEEISKVIDWKDIDPSNTSVSDDDEFQISDIEFIHEEDNSLAEVRGGAAAANMIKFSSAKEVDLETVMGALQDAAKGSKTSVSTSTSTENKLPKTPTAGTKIAEDSVTTSKPETSTEAKQSATVSALLDAAAIATDIAQIGSPARSKLEFTDASGKAITAKPVMPSLHKLLKVKIEPGTEPLPSKSHDVPDATQPKGEKNSDSSAVAALAATSSVTTNSSPSKPTPPASATPPVLKPVVPSMPSPSPTPEKGGKPNSPTKQDDDTEDSTGNESEEIVEPDAEQEVESEKEEAPTKKRRLYKKVSPPVKTTTKSPTTKTTPPNKKLKATTGDSAVKKPRAPRISEMQQLKIANTNVHYSHK